MPHKDQISQDPAVTFGNSESPVHKDGNEARVDIWLEVSRFVPHFSPKCLILVRCQELGPGRVKATR